MKPKYYEVRMYKLGDPIRNSPTETEEEAEARAVELSLKYRSMRIELWEVVDEESKDRVVAIYRGGKRAA